MLGNENITCSSQNYYTIVDRGDDAKPFVTIAILFVLVMGVWVLWLRPSLERRQPHPSIPMIPNSHWLLGHLFWLLRLGYLERMRSLAEHADERGRCSIWMGILPSIALTTPADAKQLLWKTQNRQSPPIFKLHFGRLIGPRNLLMMNGKEWKYYQSALRTALSRLDPSVLESITKTTTEILTGNLKAKIKRAGAASSIEIDSIQALMKMITMDIFGRSVFSHDFECCSKVDLCDFARDFEFMERDVIDRCTKHILLPQNLLYWIPTRRNSKFNEKRSLVRGLLKNILQKQRSNGKVVNDNIVSKILEAHTKADTTPATKSSDFAALSDEDLVDILLSILLAGYETVSTALTYAIFLITRHPEWEKRCLEEIDAATYSDDNNKKQSSDDKMLKLPTCRGAIMEALRLYPVAPGSSRTLEKPLTFKDGVTIPKGCQAGASFWLIHRNERNFPKPLEFRPDRWIPDSRRHHCCVSTNVCEHGGANDSIPAGDSDAFFAFSGGARSCPGQNFALREATFAFSSLIKDLRFHIDPDYELDIEYKGIVQGPKGGIPARVSIRT
jgi:cytochrome P450